MPSAIVPVLCSRRWNIPVLARLEPGDGETFGALRDALEICRDSLTRTLRGLEDPGWVVACGRLYGLTTRGQSVAAPSARILEVVRTQEVESVMLRKWPLVIADSLHGWSLGFAELRAMVGPISPRALTLALKDMAAAGIIERKVIGGFPPSTSYRLTDRGEAFLPFLEELGDPD